MDKKQIDSEGEERLSELRALLEKELIALLSHPLVPEEFKTLIEELE